MWEPDHGAHVLELVLDTEHECSSAVATKDLRHHPVATQKPGGNEGSLRIDEEFRCSQRLGRPCFTCGSLQRQFAIKQKPKKGDQFQRKALIPDGGMLALQTPGWRPEPRQQPSGLRLSEEHEGHA